MTCDEAMSFWYGRVNYEMRSPKASDLKLDRMRTLLELLGNPHHQLRIIHIAGTKGKGSTSAMLASILRCAKFRTGLFTSPHLVHVEERIQVDGTPITAGEIAALMEEIEAAVRQISHAEHGDVTFFEIATALGFLHFQRRQVDFAVVEVGLGGRFDSTNVCDPLLAIITNISFDHTQQLGNTLAKIAGEKAGIVKHGRPVLNGARAPEAQEVIQTIAAERQAPLHQLGRDFGYRHVPARIGLRVERMPCVQVTTWRRSWPEFEVGLLGEHQAANAAVAVTAVEHLIGGGIVITDDAVAEGLAQVDWPARFEIVGRDPLVILDCAHNVASAEALLETLQASIQLPNSGRRFLIFAGNRDKDLAGMLRILSPHFDTIYLTTFGNNPRCATPDELRAQVGAPAAAVSTAYATAPEAWAAAKREARAGDLICIAGSVFLAGELRPLIVSPTAPAIDRSS